ncbi:MAG TPA: class I lanthipeptide [Kofleriaceae bacterium]|nr:class I lanthipeptide [Kofleriaceae bacterium]
MKRSKIDRLSVRRETLRQLDASQLGDVVGGAKPVRQVVAFDLQAYLKYCNGTVYP